MAAAAAEEENDGGDRRWLGMGESMKGMGTTFLFSLFLFGFLIWI